MKTGVLVPFILLILLHVDVDTSRTRMHSSRMLPAAHWPYAAVFFPGRGVLPAGGVSLVWGVFSLVWGGSPWWGGFCLVGGFSLVRGCLPGPRGVSAWSRGVSGDPPPSVDRITDTCKNITLATTSLRPVTSSTIVSRGKELHGVWL